MAQHVKCLTWHRIVNVHRCVCARTKEPARIAEVRYFSTGALIHPGNMCLRYEVCLITIIKWLMGEFKFIVAFLIYRKT